MKMNIRFKPESYWFVGATWEGNDDQTPRFLSEGIWENGYDDRYLDLVRSMRPGDRIAIKSRYTRKDDLPFDNRGLRVSVMVIKAIGTITENRNDGKRVRVDWEEQNRQREWYFKTYGLTVHRIQEGTSWETDDLLAFTFGGKPQDIDRLRNAPYWRERFGDDPDNGANDLETTPITEPQTKMKRVTSMVSKMMSLPTSTSPSAYRNSTKSANI